MVEDTNELGVPLLKRHFWPVREGPTKGSWLY